MSDQNVRGPARLKRLLLRSGRRGSVAIAMLLVMVLLSLIIVTMVVSGAGDHDGATRRIETVRAFYGRDSGHEAAARFRAVLERRFPTLFREMKI